MSSSSFSPSEEQLSSPLRVFFCSVRVLLNEEYRTPKWWLCHAPPYPRKMQGNHCFGSCLWLSPQTPQLKTTFLTCEAELCSGSPPELCVCVFSSHSFWTSSSLDVSVGVTQEEGRIGCLIRPLSAVRTFIFLARRIQPFLSLVDREVDFSVLTI